MVDWAELADSEISRLSDLLDNLLRKPTRASLALLLGEILGDDGASDILSSNGNQLPVVLNSSTFEELRPFIKEGWISLKSTGATSPMGTGCSVGNHIEEKKRPYGMGNGFVLAVFESDANSYKK